jgi:hypothetical protein
MDLLNDKSLFDPIAEHESVGLDREEEEVYGFIAVDREDCKCFAVCSSSYSTYLMMCVLYSHSESEAGVDVEDEEEEEEEDGDGNDENGSTITDEGLGEQVLKAWNKRRTKLEHEYAVAGWALSVLPEVRADALERITGEHRDMIESVVLRLHVPPCPNKNPKIRGMTDEEITDLF